LKVRTSGNYDLPTIDETSPNGKPFLNCLNDEMEDNGRSAISAILFCDSPNSPVTDVSVPAVGAPFDHVGSVTIANAVQAEQWVCLRHLTGDLNVPSSSLEHIDLPVLESVSGDANLVYDRPGLSYFEETRRISAPLFNTVGGDLNLSSPAATPNQVIQYRIGLDALTSVGGTVDVSAQAFNTDLYGLSNLVSIPGDLSIVTGSGDTFMYGFLSDLTAVTGDVFVDIGHSSGGVLRALQTVGGDFEHVDGNIIITGSPSYGDLVSVGGNLTFANTAPNGPSNVQLFPSLTSVGATLTYENIGSGRSEILLGAPMLTVGALTVTNNPALTTMGAANIDVVGSGLILVTNNANLCDSSISAWMGGQMNWTGPSSVSGNDAGC